MMIRAANSIKEVQRASELSGKADIAASWSLVAERVRGLTGNWDDSGSWTQLKSLSGEWKEDVRPILEMYTDRLPGSEIQEKDFSLSWHYHKSDIEQASYIRRQLADHLISLTANMGVQVFQGSGVFQITSSGINKGDLARHWLGSKNNEFILALGGDRSDELLFRSLPGTAYSVKIGINHTDARYIIPGHNDVAGLLKKFKYIAIPHNQIL